jgi:5'-3' exoribonuclease 1
MHRLGIAFRSWMKFKMQTDEFWKRNGATVIFSGPDVPGEGEHKVMDMIRNIQSEQGYQLGSLRHCMYGLDADLIMLSLATHEPHFILLREKIHKRKLQHKESKTFSQEDFELLEVTLLRQMLTQHFRKLVKPKGSIPLQTMTMADASELISIQDTPNSEDEPINIKPAWERAPTTNSVSSQHEERVIDDFIFMCFFVGNDFLPSMPHMVSH